MNLAGGADDLLSKPFDLRMDALVGIDGCPFECRINAAASPGTGAALRRCSALLHPLKVFFPRIVLGLPVCDVIQRFVGARTRTIDRVRVVLEVRFYLLGPLCELFCKRGIVHGR